ncbi:MAG: L-threonylcarbamoyladenylate synthase [Bacteriovoracaceae bacterium]|jgi:L-threonylcarbamoyladenylate synthase|nr:L-threonylcarbamoyladenylate synthase [Bacteriovoracaceae bacterium]
MQNQIDTAIEHLNNDQVVGMPTETVYGLAGRINSAESIKRIFSTKDRPFFDPLIVHVSNIEMAKSIFKNWNSTIETLANHFWPGPLTIVAKKASHIDDMITSGLDNVGVRMPNHKVALELIDKIQIPLAAPSANKFKKTSPTTKAHVESEFGKEVFVLDGGACDIGIESTVIGVEEGFISIYRPGMITKDMIENIFKDQSIKVEYKKSPVAPGQLEHHYMPKLDLTIASEEHNLNLGEYNTWIAPDNAAICARELYSKLRELDNGSNSKNLIILKEKFKSDQAWDGILNRLRKAKTVDNY